VRKAVQTCLFKDAIDNAVALRFDMRLNQPRPAEGLELAVASDDAKPRTLEEVNSDDEGENPFKDPSDDGVSRDETVDPFADTGPYSEEARVSGTGPAPEKGVQSGGALVVADDIDGWESCYEVSDNDEF
jgi:hypothetical protein